MIEVAWDERFILAKQQHLKDGRPVWWRYSYWILDVTKPECFGPFNAEEFATRRAELGVPDGLELKHVTSFIPKTEERDDPATDVVRVLVLSLILVPLGLLGGALGLIAVMDAVSRLKDGRPGWRERALGYLTVAVAFAVVSAAFFSPWVAVGAAAILVIRGAVVCIRQGAAFLADAVSSWGG